MQAVTDKTYLLGKDDDKTFENADEINEEVQWVRDKILIAMPAFLNNQLSVIEDKTTHQQQSQVQMDLVDQVWAEEQVC